MSDHQFEKNVRKQLDELKFHPDAAVWTAVEKRIGSPKRKRRGIVWIPVLLLLTASGYWVVENRSKNNNNNQTANQTSIVPDDQQTETIANTPDQVFAPSQKPGTRTSPSTPPIPVKQSEITPAEKSSGRVAASLEQTVPGSTSTSQKRIGDANQVHSNEILLKKPTSNTTPTSTPSNKINPLIARIPFDSKVKPVNDPLSGTITNKMQAPTALQKKSGDHAPAIKESTKASAFPVNPVRTEEQKDLKDSGYVTYEAITDQQNLKDSVTSVSRVNTTPATTIIDSVTVAVVAPVEKQQSKWQLGINLQGGLSNVTDGGLFDVTQKSLVQDVASNSFSSPLPANAFLPMPSDIRPAFSYGAGVFVKKPVSKRLDLSAGIQYTFLQTSIQVGQWTQTNWMVMNARGTMDVNAFYRAGTQQEYKNQYHFVELPLQASLRLNKRRQYPLTVSTGLVLGRLLSSNALHFDGASRVYYEDNSLFNKTQFGFTGGLSIGLLQSTGHPLAIGPFLHYRATNLMKQNVSVERHLLSFGLEVKVLMKK
jgi:hypothetical protein